MLVRHMGGYTFLGEFLGGEVRLQFIEDVGDFLKFGCGGGVSPGSAEVQILREHKPLPPRILVSCLLSMLGEGRWRQTARGGRQKEYEAIC